MNNNPDLEKILKSFPGIESSTSVFKLSNMPIAVDGNFSEVKKSTVVGPNGIEEKKEIIFRSFDCGCMADREGKNFGGICSNHYKKLPYQLRGRDINAGLSGESRPLYICKEHFIVCQSCKIETICIHCWHLIKDIPYCGICFMLVFFRIKKEVSLCLDQTPKNRLPMR